MSGLFDTLPYANVHMDFEVSERHHPLLFALLQNNRLLEFFIISQYMAKWKIINQQAKYTLKYN